MYEKVKTAYLGSEEFLDQLRQELKGIIHEHGRLILTDQEPQKTYWAQNIWFEPEVISFNSISEASNHLKAIQRNWACYSLSYHRRASLIQAKLPYISEKPVQFPLEIPKLPMGSWTLLDKNEILFSKRCSSLFSHGEINFQECKDGPPSRAYLKLWEALTMAQKMPTASSKCLEIGASPGGWTFVLANLGAEVLAVDRSELAPHVMKMKGVHFIKGDAFSMTPSKVGAVDWIFSDVACYPEKLLEWVKLWITSGQCKNFICTLKFQGDSGYKVVDDFLKIQGSRITHLKANKHELTWILTE